MPGAPSGTVFRRIDDSALNEAGQLAFFGATGWNHSTAIWATDREGNLRLIARLGQTIDVDDGPGVDMRTIQSFLVTSEITNHDRNILSMGRRGHVAFRAQFTDGSYGVLVSSLVAVPEPHSGLLLALGLVFLFGANQKKRRG